MMKVIAKHIIKRGAETYHAGDVFEVSSDELEAMRNNGIVVEAVAEPAKPEKAEEPVPEKKPVARKKK